MAAAALGGVPTVAVPLVVAAAVLTLAGLRFRWAASVAVLAIAGALALGNAAAPVAVVTGIAAALYLLSVHTIDLPPGVVAVTPSVLGAALGFGAAGLLASTLPGRHAWWPLIAPVTVVLIYLLAVGPLRSEIRDDRNPSGGSEGSATPPPAGHLRQP
jgi:hypothetical protein